MACSMCVRSGKSYASAQILKQHAKVTHGAGWPEEDEVLQCPHCQKRVLGEDEYAGTQWGVPSETRP